MLFDILRMWIIVLNVLTLISLFWYIETLFLSLLFSNVNLWYHLSNRTDIERFLNFWIVIFLWRRKTLLTFFGCDESHVNFWWSFKVNENVCEVKFDAVRIISNIDFKVISQELVYLCTLDFLLKGFTHLAEKKDGSKENYKYFIHYRVFCQHLRHSCLTCSKLFQKLLNHSFHFHIAQMHMILMTNWRSLHLEFRVIDEIIYLDKVLFKIVLFSLIYEFEQLKVEDCLVSVGLLVEEFDCAVRVDEVFLEKWWVFFCFSEYAS